MKAQKKLAVHEKIQKKELLKLTQTELLSGGKRGAFNEIWQKLKLQP